MATDGRQAIRRPEATVASVGGPHAPGRVRAAAKAPAENPSSTDAGARAEARGQGQVAEAAPKGAVGVTKCHGQRPGHRECRDQGNRVGSASRLHRSAPPAGRTTEARGEARGVAHSTGGCHDRELECDGRRKRSSDRERGRTKGKVTMAERNGAKSGPRPRRSRGRGARSRPHIAQCDQER